MKFNDQFEMASLITMKTDEVKQALGGSYIVRTFERKTRLDKHLICHVWNPIKPVSPGVLLLPMYLSSMAAIYNLF